MASPPLGERERRWTASPWLPLVPAEIARSPATHGVVILGDGAREPILATAGIIRDELWRIHGSPRSTANGTDFFRYIELGDGAASGRLAQAVFEELTRVTGHRIAWRDFPPLPSGEPGSTLHAPSIGP